MSQGGTAWSDFLAAYTPFIQGCIRRVAEDYDEQMDIYLHVCARLHADDCRRVRQFRGGTAERPCKFTTWLATVTMNLAREWIRQSRGRRRMFRVIERMPRLNQIVFRYHHWEGFSADEILQLLRAQHGVELGAAELASILAEIRVSLGRDRRWRLLSRGGRHARHHSLSGPAGDSSDDPRPIQVASTEPSGDDRVRERGAATALRAAIAELPLAQRQAIELRFTEGLAARQIARRLGIDSYKRVYELQARALLQLRSAMKSSGWEIDDFPKCETETGAS
jgi:RNA polymerase sigma factor (sigma-70 family)